MGGTNGPGPIALVGGGAWQEGCEFDEGLLAAAGPPGRAGRPEVLVVPTAAAFEHPQHAVETARRWFGRHGADVRELSVLTRPDAEDEQHAEVARAARFFYLADGSPLHLRSVLKDSAVWDAIVAAWQEGAVLAGSGAGAMVFGVSMVDPRGGALTLGLGLLSGLALLPHADTWSPEKAHRTVELATGHLRIAAVDERTALLRDGAGTWRAAGAGSVAVYLDGRPAGLDSLPA
jgi:cyanophycinase